MKTKRGISVIRHMLPDKTAAELYTPAPRGPLPPEETWADFFWVGVMPSADVESAVEHLRGVPIVPLRERCYRYGDGT
jgi:hypothetical protein